MSTPIPASDVVFDMGGCRHHSRHWLGCMYCKKNRDEMLQQQRERAQLASFLAETQLSGKRPYYELVAEEYNAGLDT